MQSKVTKLSAKKLMNKMVAIVLVITLTFANLLFLGSYFTETFAATKEIEEQDISTNVDNVKFDAYFTTQDNNKTHSAVMYIDNPATLNLYLKVEQDGYLKNATIEFKGEGNQKSTNFDITGQLSGTKILQSVTYKEKRIVLRQINKNTEATLIVPLGLEIGETFDITKVNQNNIVILKGTYVDGNGNEQEVECEKIINLGWIGEYTNSVTSKVEKYVPFATADKKGIVIQTTVESYINEEKVLPIKEENIVAKAPMFNGFAPENVIVTAKSLMATTGLTEENAMLSQENWSYNPEDQTVTINIKNNELIKTTWSGNGKDIFYITYIYSQEAYDSIQNLEQPVIIESDINSKISIYNNTEIVDVENTYKLQAELTEQIGNIVTYELENTENNIIKGNMYANYQSEESDYETEFGTRWNINISYKEIIENLQVQDIATYFSDEEENRYATRTIDNDFVYYKQTTINKENFDRILGEEGYIEILDQSDNVIYTINKDTEVDNDNNYIINYEDKYSTVKLNISKPVLEGNIIIEHKKAITSDLAYSKLQVTRFNKLITSISGNEKYVNEENYRELPTIEANSNLTETQTKADLLLETDVFSTLVENKNVEIKIRLNNSTNTSDLYQNPIFQIEFPTYIEKVDVKKENVKVLYSDELQIQDIKTINKDGKIFLQIHTSGTQTKFGEGISGGTTIILTANIKAQVTTPALESEIKLSYYNQNAIKYEKEEKWHIQDVERRAPIAREDYVNGSVSETIRFAAPLGLINAININNFNDANESIISVEQGEVLGKIEIADSRRTVNLKLLVVNNFENPCENVVILGRLPFKDNKSIINGENLGTTVNTTLRSEIVPSGIDKDKITVYYSENGDATVDLNNPENGWTTEISDLSKIKSFLAVTNNYTLQPATSFSLGFNIEIPENLQHNNNIFPTFATYYVNSVDGTGTTEIVEADKVGLTTGKGPEIELQKSVSVGENSPVKELKRIEYTIVAKNIGNEPVENVVITDTIPDGAIYTRYESAVSEESISGYILDYDTKNLQWKVSSIQPNKSVSVQYEVLVDELPTVPQYYSNLQLDKDDEGKYYMINSDGSRGEEVTLPEIKLGTSATVEANDLEKPLSSNTVENVVEQANFEIDFKSYTDQETKLREKQELIYSGTVTNITDKNIENVVIKNKLPDGLKLTDAYIDTYEESYGEEVLVPNRDNVVYDEVTNEIIFNVGTIEMYDQRIITIVTEVEEFGADEYERVFISTLDAVAGDVTETSEKVQNIAGRPKLVIDVNKTVDVDTLYEGEEAEFIITVKNEGTIPATNVTLTNQAPEELRINNVEYGIGDEKLYKSANSDGSLKIVTTIPENETLTARIGVVAKKLSSGVSEKEVSNFVTVKTDTEELNGETLTYIVKAVSTDEEEQNPSDSKTHTISGNIWIDADQNGKKDEIENKIEGVTVKLLSATDNTVLKTTVTDANGNYRFREVENGNYLVVIMYNTTMYRITDYHKEGVATDVNSDFISTTLQENGNSQLAAVTDIIKVQGANQTNIDLGLIESEQFDLSLSKQLSKITVQAENGVTYYDYQNTTTAKIDLNEKYVEGTNVIIEYKIVVRNEGAVEGYVKKIVDYLTDELEFKSELNTNWYMGQDGYLYNKELEDQVIYPGEQKEVKLILTKTMTENNLGIVNNTAEIHEAYNQEGLMDIDSTPSNMAQGEDDRGVADVMITIRTGSPVMYTSIVLISLIIIGLGVFFIRKKIIKPKNNIIIED